MDIQESKELVMKGYKLFQAGDIRSLLDMYHDDAEWTGPESEYLAYSGNYHGKQGIAQFFTNLNAAVQALHMEPKQIIAEGDTVVVIGDSTWLARNTGRQYDNPFVHVFNIRDGKVARFTSYWDTGPAERAQRTELGAGQPGLSTPLHH
ncbi:nuclear transport factor 2 family protein [Pseudoduganella sp. RAF53_2]|jgi:ketosteroid isomerase-like protein|uniref:nuclear transport factor 2 family protein n=1 Tax=unclassified Pseudoduganella TaxID=2637179 RepID=UPI003F9AFFA5